MKKQFEFSSLPDYHLHTVLCKHAKGDIADYRTAAKKNGITEICFSDHCPNPDGYDPDHRMGMKQFETYRDMVSRLQDSEFLTVLFGIEADYYEGCEVFLREWLPSQGFDYVIGSVHYIEGWGFDNPSQRHVWDSVDVTATWQKYFELVGRLADSRLFDAVGHLDLPKKFGFRPPDKDAGADMGMELNTSGLRRPVGEIYPSPLIVSMAHEREIPICFGSDAHAPDEIGAGFGLALNLAKEAGYTQYFRIRGRTKELVALPETLSVQESN